MTGVDYDVVVPTIGRPSLVRLLRSLADTKGPAPAHVLLVDDRRHRQRPLLEGVDPKGEATRRARRRSSEAQPRGRSDATWSHLGTPLEVDATELGLAVKVITGRAAGPAAARNDGWRAATAEWVAFLDDDVEVGGDWLRRLSADLAGLPATVGASQGRIVVPAPMRRRPTDWERNVAGLAGARWATADMAYRRRVLAAVDGFDERFGRAYREDADLGLRVTGAGWSIVTGDRAITHPVGPAPWSVSVAKQRGNLDDALMARIHGSGWRGRAGAPAGRRPVHLATTAAWLGAAATAVGGHRRAALIAAAVGAALTGELAARRIAPGPRTAHEVATMVATSVAIPPAASVWWARGVLRARGIERRRPVVALDAVMFDRDATLIDDVAYNGDPEQVRPVPGARHALDRLRAAGVAVGIVSNQSGVARGWIEPAQVDAVNARVAELLGPFDAVVWCPHGPDDGCGCRKPAPGLVHQAAERLGVAARACAVVGDIGADVEAAAAAGARGILVPTAVTRFEEVDAAREVVADLGTAVDRLLSDRPPPSNFGRRWSPVAHIRTKLGALGASSRVGAS